MRLVSAPIISPLRLQVRRHLRSPRRCLQRYLRQLQAMCRRRYLRYNHLAARPHYSHLPCPLMPLHQFQHGRQRSNRPKSHLQCLPAPHPLYLLYLLQSYPQSLHLRRLRRLQALLPPAALHMYLHVPLLLPALHTDRKRMELLRTLSAESQKVQPACWFSQVYLVDGGLKL